MPKYEIMLLINNEITKDNIVNSINPIISLFNKLPNYESKFIYDDKLAYPIKKKLFAHRVILNFSLDNSSKIKEFKEISNLNKNILRYLLINLEKDYGYKSSVNEKKLKLAAVKQERFKKYLETKSQKASKILENQ